MSSGSLPGLGIGMTLYKNSLNTIETSKHNCQGAWFIVTHENLKESCLKPLIRIQNNLVKWSPGDLQI